MNIKVKPDLFENHVPVVEQQQFRAGMAQLAAAVNIITTDGVAGKAGFTASAVCSVTDTPPTLLVCLNRSASVFDTFRRNQVLCVNTLASHQQDLSNLFGGKTPMQTRFAQGEWHCLVTGSPVLADAVVSFDCVVQDSHSVGSHDILICEVRAMTQPQAEVGLIYFNRRYCEPVAMN